MVDPRITYAAALVVALEGATGARWELERRHEHLFIARRSDWPASILVERFREPTERSYEVRIRFCQRASVEICVGAARIGTKTTSTIDASVRRIAAALPIAVSYWEGLVLESRLGHEAKGRAEALAREIGVLVGGLPWRSPHERDAWEVRSSEGLIFFISANAKGGPLVQVRRAHISEQLALALARAHRDHDREGRAAS